MSSWIDSSGHIVVDSSGHAIECPDCPCGETPGDDCANCDSGTTPLQRIAEFSGADTPTCCSGVNINTDQFLLEQGAGECSLGFLDDCDIFVYLSVGLTFNSDHLIVKILSENDGSYIEFRKNYSASPNCMSESVGSIAYDNHNFDGICGFNSGMTCTLSIP